MIIVVAAVDAVVPAVVGWQRPRIDLDQIGAVKVVVVVSEIAVALARPAWLRRRQVPSPAQEPLTIFFEYSW